MKRFFRGFNNEQSDFLIGLDFFAIEFRVQNFVSDKVFQAKFLFVLSNLHKPFYCTPTFRNFFYQRRINKCFRRQRAKVLSLENFESHDFRFSLIFDCILENLIYACRKSFTHLIY